MSPTAATFAIGVVAGRGSMAPVVAGAAGVIWSGVKPAGRLMTGGFGSKRPVVAAAAPSSGFDAGATASDRCGAGLEIACVVFGSSIFGAGSASWVGAGSPAAIGRGGGGLGKRARRGLARVDRRCRCRSRRRDPRLGLHGGPLRRRRFAEQPERPQ